MNILVIGNGFDLAHGLPTKYKEFLDFVESFKSIINSPQILKEGYLECTAKPIYEYLDRLIFREKVLCDEMKKMVLNNFWIDYFLQCNMYQKDNWIDFESEISNVIQSLDNDMIYLEGKRKKIGDNVAKLSNKFLKKIYGKQSNANVAALAFAGVDSQHITYKEIRDKLVCDLNRLIRALEIYLTDYVEKIEIKVDSPDIRGCRAKESETRDVINIIKVLNFNYTDTFMKRYSFPERNGRRINIEYDYIHGKADVNNSIITNNMVLGIDEYLPDNRKNKEVEFIAFKKFYQRIHKETGCKYKEWVDEIRDEYAEYQRKINDVNVEIIDGIKNGSFNRTPFQREKYTEIFREECPKHNLYIFGHSLDVTDGDILRDLILNDNVRTTIYYLDKDMMGQQIANLVKVIGQDELIRRTGGSTKTIEFKMQQEMIER